MLSSLEISAKVDLYLLTCEFCQVDLYLLTCEKCEYELLTCEVDTNQLFQKFLMMCQNHTKY